MSPIDELQRVVEHELPAGWHGHYWRSLASTQDAARSALGSGAQSRSVFVADFQTAGRGRRGRTWLARPGTALLVSILLSDTQPPGMWRSTALASVALIDAIQHFAPMLRASIKWPNDVLIDGRKVAGILAESTWDGKRASVIVGVGVNVTSEPADLEGLSTATSLWIESGQCLGRGELLRAFLSQLDAWLQEPEAELRATWQSRLWGRGQRLRLAEPEGEFEVIVLGAEPDGSLRVRLPDGTERTSATGELML